MVRCHVKGKHYKNNTVGVFLKNMFFRNMKMQKYKVSVAEAIRMCSMVVCNDCYGLLDNNGKLSCVIFVSSHIAEIKFLGQNKIICCIVDM